MINDTNRKEYALYILLNKSDNSFFIWYCDAKNVYDAFRLHYSLKFMKTKEWIENIKKQNKKPCIFILERINGTREDCYALTLIWTKIFIGNNFISIESDNVLNDVRYLYENNLEKYYLRTQYNLNKIVGCEGCILPFYKNIYCENYKENNLDKLKPISRDNKKINLSISKDEYDYLMSQSKKNNISISQYVKNASLNNQVHIYDFKIFNEYKEIMEKINKKLNVYLITAISTQQVFSNEVGQIQELMNEIISNQNKIISLLNKEIKLITKSKRRKQLYGNNKN